MNVFLQLLTQRAECSFNHGRLGIMGLNLSGQPEKLRTIK